MIAVTKNPEPECVRIKRHGAEHVTRLIGKMTLDEQLAFWRQRTDLMRKRQAQQRQPAEALADRVDDTDVKA
jgi:hypothetical protein